MLGQTSPMLWVKGLMKQKYFAQDKPIWVIYKISNSVLITNRKSILSKNNSGKIISNLIKSIFFRTFAGLRIKLSIIV